MGKVPDCTYYQGQFISLSDLRSNFSFQICHLASLDQVINTLDLKGEQKVDVILTVL